MQNIKHFFENRSVGTKLGLAFAGVLILTLIVALTGRYGFTQLNQRGHKIISTYQFNQYVGLARVARNSYSRQSTDANYQVLLEQVEVIDHWLEQQLSLFHSPDEQHLLQTIYCRPFREIW